MKRILSFVLCISIIMSLGVFVSAVNFSDLADEHWAYASIKTLVEEGTINGYEDGTFKPNKSVTRAEFVKMLGKWNQKYQGKYNDISENHWAYEYIMWSGLDPIGTDIYPDVEIKRSDVINLIWKRNGSVKHDLAPSIISSQGTNPDATSWAYTIGLVKGDDGLNLRLDSSLTRAEAATLIIRSRELVAAGNKNNFLDVVDENILKTTYESLDLLDVAYSSDRTITYGELARMAIVFGADGKTIQFVGNDLLDSNNKPVEFFEHQYTNEMFILSSKIWGAGYYTPKKIDEPATVQDAISAIMYGFARRGTTPTDLGVMDAYYPDCTDAKSTTRENMYLSYACTKGIKLTTDKNIGANSKITLKQYSALLVQFNDAIGLAISYSNGSKNNTKISTYLPDYPENYKDFKNIIQGAPIGLYSLKGDNVLAKSSYNVINMFAFAYEGYFNEVRVLAKNRTGYDMETVFYPSLSYKQNNRISFVGKFIVKEKSGSPKEVLLDELFKEVLKVHTGYKIKTDTEFFVVFETFEPVLNNYLPYDEAYIKAIYTK